MTFLRPSVKKYNIPVFTHIDPSDFGFVDYTVNHNLDSTNIQTYITIGGVSGTDYRYTDLFSNFTSKNRGHQVNSITSNSFTLRLFRSIEFESTAPVSGQVTSVHGN